MPYLIIQTTRARLPHCRRSFWGRKGSSIESQIHPLPSTEGAVDEVLRDHSSQRGLSSFSALRKGDSVRLRRIQIAQPQKNLLELFKQVELTFCHNLDSPAVAVYCSSAPLLASTSREERKTTVAPSLAQDYEPVPGSQSLPAATY
jgi:hypothetical protein